MADSPRADGDAQWTERKSATGLPRKSGHKTHRPSCGLAVDDAFLEAYDPKSKAKASAPASSSQDAVDHAVARSKALAKLDVAGAGILPAEKPHASSIRLLRPWFTQPALEEDYREAAYALQRPSLVRYFGIMMGVYVCFFLIESGRYASGDKFAGDAEFRWAYTFVRSVAISVSVLITYLLHRERLSHQTALRCCLLIVTLVALVPSLDISTSTAEPPPGETPDVPTESFELMAVFVYAYAPRPSPRNRHATAMCPPCNRHACIHRYSTLVPIFPVRYVGVVMPIITVANALLLRCPLIFVQRQSLRTLLTSSLFMELLKGVALNVCGLYLALFAERSRRSNFVNAMLYHEEVILMSAVRNDVQVGRNGNVTAM